VTTTPSATDKPKRLGERDKVGICVITCGAGDYLWTAYACLRRQRRRSASVRSVA
jgi:hypothetical protein